VEAASTGSLSYFCSLLPFTVSLPAFQRGKRSRGFLLIRIFVQGVDAQIDGRWSFFDSLGNVRRNVIASLVPLYDLMLTKSCVCQSDPPRCAPRVIKALRPDKRPSLKRYNGISALFFFSRSSFPQPELEHSLFSVIYPASTARPFACANAFPDSVQ